LLEKFLFSLCSLIFLAEYVTMLLSEKKGVADNMETIKIQDIDLEEEISIYARISVDTEDENDDNTSIENQLRIIKNYIQQHFPKCTVKEYVDRDRSGYTFEQRESYQVMRKELMYGKSKILIVKDFSRFSRRTSLGLWELEQMRDCGVRIISIMDGCDYPTHDDWLSISIRFMTNELPVTSTSKNVKQSVKTMQKVGEWLCAVPYGYILETVRNKTVITVVPDEAVVVKEVYRLYAYEGWGYKKIANYLTSKGIPTPRMKEKQRAEENGKEYKRKVSTAWSVETLDGMLRNDFYCGTYRGNKYTRKKINGADIKLDESEHIVIKDHHEPILDDRLYRYTQDQLDRRTGQATHYRGTKKYDTPYTSYLFCGDCQAPMFSRSTPRLAPSYICGTYHKRGLAGCTAHHIRVDFLDGILKDYVRFVRDNSQDMIKELEKAIATEVDAVKESEKTIKLLESQLESAKAELKAVEKMKIKRMAQDESLSIDDIDEMYAEIEQEALDRVKGARENLKIESARRSKVVEIARVSKTVFEVFDNIINKDSLDRVDIGLIVDRIFVYEDNRIEIKLKADIESLLQTGDLPSEEKVANFNFDSIDIEYSTVYAQKVRNQLPKVYTVNVISEGDPLEIFTDRDGEVIFKKYSPIGELLGFASQYAETLYKTSGHPVIVCDRDSIVAFSGVSKKECNEKKVSPDIESIMESRQMYTRKNDGKNFYVVDGNEKIVMSCAVPIISGGDVIGAVVSTQNAEETMTEPDETEIKLVQTAATFLGKQMEE